MKTPAVERSVAPVRVGISSCLLGENVRFDGGHKRDRFLTDTLAQFVEWVPVCPEMEMGLGAPRESLRLVGDALDPRLVAPKSGSDHTEGMKAYARDRFEILEGLELSGYLLKSDSPSCGMERVRVYGDASMPMKKGAGIFARALMERFPLLPVEEEGRLHDPAIRESFFERLFAYRRFRALDRPPHKMADLVRFHSEQKYLILSHSPKHYREMGQLVAQTKPPKRRKADLVAEYGKRLMAALAVKATRGKHANVLHHILGFLKDALAAEDKAELVAVIDRYRRGLVPLVVPITLVNHHLRHHDAPWVKGQVYLDPHPIELMLRNHV
jgi:uncharacterized protein YbgA (DUF1722 family)/uncharacterized protein YbbK (DUF523 family)